MTFTKSDLSMTLFIVILLPNSISPFKVVFLPTVFNISISLLHSNTKLNVPSLNVVGSVPSNLNSLALPSDIGFNIILLSPIFNIKFLLPIKLQY